MSFCHRFFWRVRAESLLVNGSRRQGSLRHDLFKSFVSSHQSDHQIERMSRYHGDWKRRDQIRDHWWPLRPARSSFGPLPSYLSPGTHLSMPAVPKAIFDVKNKLSARVLMNPMPLKVGTHSLHPFSSLFIDLRATMHPFLFHEWFTSFHIYFGVTVVHYFSKVHVGWNTLQLRVL